jgi:hypothetical protein
LFFKGVTEYLEDFLVRINTPDLIIAMITFFNRVNFNIPQLFKFVSHKVALGLVKRAKLTFYDHLAKLFVPHPSSPYGSSGDTNGFPVIGVLCNAFDWKVSFLIQICSQLWPLLSGVEELVISCYNQDPLDWQDVDHTQWLELFRPFIAVQHLDICGLEELIAPALRELTGARVMEVLPALRTLGVIDPGSSGSVRQALQPFITARNLSNHPVTVLKGKLY